MTDLTKLTIAEARKKLRAKEINAGELTDAYLGRDRRGQRHLNAYIVGDPRQGARHGCGLRREAG